MSSEKVYPVLMGLKVTWKSERPSLEELRVHVENFFDTAATIETKELGLVATLPGKPGYFAREKWHQDGERRRTVEVNLFETNSIHIVCCVQDQLTLRAAEALGQLFHSVCYFMDQKAGDLPLPKGLINLG